MRGVEKPLKSAARNSATTHGQARMCRGRLGAGANRRLKRRERDDRSVAVRSCVIDRVALRSTTREWRRLSEEGIVAPRRSRREIIEWQAKTHDLKKF